MRWWKRYGRRWTHRRHTRLFRLHVQEEWRRAARCHPHSILPELEAFLGRSNSSASREQRRRRDLDRHSLVSDQVVRFLQSSALARQSIGFALRPPVGHRQRCWCCSHSKARIETVSDHSRDRSGGQRVDPASPQQDHVQHFPCAGWRKSGRRVPYENMRESGRRSPLYQRRRSMVERCARSARTAAAQKRKRVVFCQRFRFSGHQSQQRAQSRAPVNVLGLSMSIDRKLILVFFYQNKMMIYC